MYQGIAGKQVEKKTENKKRKARSRLGMQGEDMPAHEKYVKSIYLKSPPPAGSYLSELPVIRNLSRIGQLTFTSPVAFLVGENGTGKSTLLEAVALSMGFNAEGGSRNFRFSTADTVSELSNYLTVVKGVRPRDGFFLTLVIASDTQAKIEQILAGLLPANP